MAEEKRDAKNTLTNAVLQNVGPKKKLVHPEKKNKINRDNI